MSKEVFKSDIDVYEPREHREGNWKLLSILIPLMAVIFLLALLSIVVGHTTLLNAAAPDQPGSEEANCKNRLGLIVMCFSPERNFKKLVSDGNESSNDLRIFHGIRVIACAFITFMHTAMQSMKIPSENIGDKSFIGFFDNPFNTFGPTVANNMVDVFFFISAFLAGNLMAKYRHRSGSLNVLSAWVFRALRLLPSIGFLLLFTMASFEMIGEGPAYPTFAYYLIGE
jgi:hypothetical protein